MNKEDKVLDRIKELREEHTSNDAVEATMFDPDMGSQTAHTQQFQKNRPDVQAYESVGTRIANKLKGLNT